MNIISKQYSTKAHVFLKTVPASHKKYSDTKTRKVLGAQSQIQLHNYSEHISKSKVADIFLWDYERHHFLSFKLQFVLKFSNLLNKIII